MGVSRIEQLIEGIYVFVESCKMSPLSSTKVVVPKDELYDLLDELRLRTPDEIKRYQKIIANRDSILADAEAKANAMLEEAQAKTNSLISEHEIMQQAYYQANEIVEQANAQAQQILAQANQDAMDIRTGSLHYSEEMLGVVESILSNAFESTKSKYDTVLTSLKDNLNTISNNKKELTDQLYGSSEEVAVSDDPMNNNDEAYEYENSNDDYLDDLD